MVALDVPIPAHGGRARQAITSTAAAKTNSPIAAPVAHRLATGRRLLLMAITTQTRPRTTRTGTFSTLRLWVDALKGRQATTRYPYVEHNP